MKILMDHDCHFCIKLCNNYNSHILVKKLLHLIKISKVKHYIFSKSVSIFFTANVTEIRNFIHFDILYWQFCKIIKHFPIDLYLHCLTDIETSLFLPVVTLVCFININFINLLNIGSNFTIDFQESTVGLSCNLLRYVGRFLTLQQTFVNYLIQTDLGPYLGFFLEILIYDRY